MVLITFSFSCLKTKEQEMRSQKKWAACSEIFVDTYRTIKQIVKVIVRVIHCLPSKNPVFVIVILDSEVY